MRQSIPHPTTNNGGFVLPELKRRIVGTPLPDTAQDHQRLPKSIALAVFSSDALSSVAYATEAILFVLLLAGQQYFGRSMWLAAGVVGLMAIVAISYSRTIYHYPNGGGAYTVATENFGHRTGLVAGAALIIDYVLTVAVSISAGTAAIVSLAGTFGYDWRAGSVEIALVGIVILVIMNLRGVKESGSVFAIPTYVFVFSILGMVITGIFKAMTGSLDVVSFTTPPTMEQLEEAQTMGIFLMLRAFSAGCTAMTGVEAISNAVPSFRKPVSKNASATLYMMVALLGAMFLGITYLAHAVNAVPIHEGETIVSQIARTVLGAGVIYGIIQLSTALILFLAGNTAFNGAPHMMSIMAQEGYLPRRLSEKGDRLAYSNAIIWLGVVSAVVVVLFGAREQAMLPLYAVGVFISFTLSQGGMYLKAREEKEKGAWMSLVGALLTASVGTVIVITRFTHGAWAVLVLIPVLVYTFERIKEHYSALSVKMRVYDHVPLRRTEAHIYVLIESINKSSINVLNWVFEGTRPWTPVHVRCSKTETVEKGWEIHGLLSQTGKRLLILDNPYRRLRWVIRELVLEHRRRHPGQHIQILMGALTSTNPLERVLHGGTHFLIWSAVMDLPDVMVSEVPCDVDQLVADPHPVARQPEDTEVEE